ncbi:hypothetical protein TcCL_NonESM00613 [Trypanosoma cruzi]|uniref:Uncharacterized protein n=1 Tax=Trypanosoma cruzi (strain CL Brener) TaxID=353153 RepID=Q4CV14_TRYCC|nr:hypothetical protein, conserved [Trypanosoma cruzi]EAN84113.1 hypothetical protein, conserved [Trypanosoma cruzi]RNC49386.1 hypothetical protein TcCL_NonESM00613 [Trypanosoma cruzi]|eukprot:XP_805964.1 hypothetical protein [Trypanosoma cruzi strain CL Brener]
MGRIETESNNSGEVQQAASEGACLLESTTPTRRLELGGESADVDTNAVVRRAWEKDITAFLASQSHKLFARDPLLELKLDDSPDGIARREQAGVSSTASPLSAASPMSAWRRRSELQDDVRTGERRHHTGDPAESRLLLYSPLRCAAEEEEEQVIIGRDVTYPDNDVLGLHSLGQAVTGMEHCFSTPRLIPTPETHTSRRQAASQVTTGCAVGLAAQALSPVQQANNVPFRSWKSREQQKVGAVAVSTGGALPEAVDGGCAGRASLSQGAAKEALGPFPKDDVMGQGDLGEGGKEDAFALPLPLSTRKSGGCDDEDAPLFCRVTPVGRRCAGGFVPVADSAGPRFTAGMRVEGRWGCRWFGAVITEGEQNGYVQLRWDEDGSLLHVKVREVRLPQNKWRMNGRRTRSLLNTPSVMTATQLVELVENETPHPELSVKEELGLKPLDEDVGVSPSFLTLYFTSAALLQLAGKRCILTQLMERGALIVEPPLNLESLSSNSSFGQRRTGENRFFFVVAEDDLKRDDGMIIAVAHAMGLSAVSVGWLEELEVDVAGEFPHVCIPKPKHLIGQDNDTFVRWRLLSSKEERFLSQKRIYVAGEDAEIAFLLQVCGGTITHQLPPDGDSPPHYLYVAPGKRAQITTSVTSVALLEKSWLFHRIHEFFLALPPPRNGRSDAGVVINSLAASPVSGVKRPRDKTEEETSTRVAEAVPLSPANADRGSSRVTFTSGGEVLTVLEGEDYYFCMPRVSGSRMHGRNKNEAPVVELGRVVRLGGDDVVTLLLYEVKYRVLRQNPHTGSLENQTTVYLGSRTATVPLENLIFNIPVYVVDASQMQHMYVLESPPRGVDAAAVGGGCAGS